MTQTYQLLDQEDRSYKLRWPRKVVRDELERRTRRASRLTGAPAASAAPTLSFLKAAFAGDALALDFSQSLDQTDPWGDPLYTERAIEWLEQLNVELATWPEPTERPSFYSQRRNPAQRTPADRSDALRRIASALADLARDGLFAEQLGLWCPDDHDQPEPEDAFADILGRRIEDFAWPPPASSLRAWSDDDVFDFGDGDVVGDDAEPLVGALVGT